MRSPQILRHISQLCCESDASVRRRRRCRRARRRARVPGPAGTVVPRTVRRLSDRELPDDRQRQWGRVQLVRRAVQDDVRNAGAVQEVRRPGILIGRINAFIGQLIGQNNALKRVLCACRPGGHVHVHGQRSLRDGRAVDRRQVVVDAVRLRARAVSGSQRASLPLVASFLQLLVAALRMCAVRWSSIRWGSACWVAAAGPGRMGCDFSVCVSDGGSSG